MADMDENRLAHLPPSCDVVCGTVGQEDRSRSATRARLFVEWVVICNEFNKQRLKIQILIFLMMIDEIHY